MHELTHTFTKGDYRACQCTVNYNDYLFNTPAN